MKFHPAIFGLFCVVFVWWFVSGPFVQLIDSSTSDAATAAVVKTSVTVRIPSVQGSRTAASVPNTIERLSIDSCSGRARGAACSYQMSEGTFTGVCGGPTSYTVLGCVVQ